MAAVSIPVPGNQRFSGGFKNYQKQHRKDRLPLFGTFEMPPGAFEMPPDSNAVDAPRVHRRSYDNDINDNHRYNFSNTFTYTDKIRHAASSCNAESITPAAKTLSVTDKATRCKSTSQPADEESIDEAEGGLLGFINSLFQEGEEKTDKRKRAREDGKRSAEWRSNNFRDHASSCGPGKSKMMKLEPSIVGLTENLSECFFQQQSAAQRLSMVTVNLASTSPLAAAGGRTKTLNLHRSPFMLPPIPPSIPLLAHVTTQPPVLACTSWVQTPTHTGCLPLTTVTPPLPLPLVTRSAQAATFTPTPVLTPAVSTAVAPRFSPTSIFAQTPDFAFMTSRTANSLQLPPLPPLGAGSQKRAEYKIPFAPRLCYSKQQRVATQQPEDASTDDILDLLALDGDYLLNADNFDISQKLRGECGGKAESNPLTRAATGRIYSCGAHKGLTANSEDAEKPFGKPDKSGQRRCEDVCRSGSSQGQRGFLENIKRYSSIWKVRNAERFDFKSHPQPYNLPSNHHDDTTHHHVPSLSSSLHPHCSNQPAGPHHRLPPLSLSPQPLQDFSQQNQKLNNSSCPHVTQPDSDSSSQQPRQPPTQSKHTAQLSTPYHYAGAKPLNFNAPKDQRRRPKPGGTVPSSPSPSPVVPREAARRRDNPLDDLCSPPSTPSSSSVTTLWSHDTIEKGTEPSDDGLYHFDGYQMAPAQNDAFDFFMAETTGSEAQSQSEAEDSNLDSLLQQIRAPANQSQQQCMSDVCGVSEVGDGTFDFMCDQSSTQFTLEDAANTSIVNSTSDGFEHSQQSPAHSCAYVSQSSPLSTSSLAATAGTCADTLANITDDDNDVCSSSQTKIRRKSSMESSPVPRRPLPGYQSMTPWTNDISTNSGSSHLSSNQEMPCFYLDPEVLRRQGSLESKSPQQSSPHLATSLHAVTTAVMETVNSLTSWQPSLATHAHGRIIGPNVMKGPHRLSAVQTHNREKRFKKTADALQKCGLWDIAMKTGNLIKRNADLQKEIEGLRAEATVFLKSVIQNPENQEIIDFLNSGVSEKSRSLMQMRPSPTDGGDSDTTTTTTTTTSSKISDSGCSSGYFSYS